MKAQYRTKCFNETHMKRGPVVTFDKLQLIPATAKGYLLNIYNLFKNDTSGNTVLQILREYNINLLPCLLRGVNND